MHDSDCGLSLPECRDWIPPPSARVTRLGDPVTVGLTRLGQTLVLEERPTAVRPHVQLYSVKLSCATIHLFCPTPILRRPTIRILRRPTIRILLPLLMNPFGSMHVVKRCASDLQYVWYVTLYAQAPSSRPPSIILPCPPPVLLPARPYLARPFLCSC